MAKQNPEVDLYLQAGCGRCDYYNTPQCKVNDWRKVMLRLRDILHQTELVEERKWGVACYTDSGKNIVLLSTLKDCATLNFLKGVLINDSHKLLVSPGENSQSARYMKFHTVEEVESSRETIIQYISEAIKNERTGKQVDFKQKNELEFPQELLDFFESDSKFKKAFYSLTPGRQRGYTLFFTAPKQSKTRISRIEKNVDKILAGNGIHDR
ncbi:MAG: hypothetical protein SCALA702_04500 [Melioribacteraceae bacterium]|nr:MAG: hypothetical protein SCALA702_04500 [Melioribacteraceae bacterium]